MYGSENQIKENIQAGRLGSALVDDAIATADLARNLERPRTEVEGRYSRANQLALKYGTTRQQIEVAYQWAWTLYWWYEDYSVFADQYGIVEGRVRGSRNAYDLEQLCNLWHNLHVIVNSGTIDALSASYSAHTATLVTELERLQSEKERPSTALQAETLLLMIHLLRRLTEKKSVDDLLRSLRDVVLQTEGLVGYPIKPLVANLTEIGQFLEGITAYAELFETIVQMVSTRDGEISAARLLLTRGEHQLQQGRPVEAIATLGRTLAPLHKHETRHEVVKALYLCGWAYHDIGLLWAARGTLLFAASVATNDLWQYGNLTPYQASCYRQLKMVELRLGRLPHILAWHELDILIRRALMDRGYNPEKLLAVEPEFDTLFVRLLLRTDFSDLKSLEGLPDVLDRIGLDLEVAALLYTLGHEERLRELAEKMGKQPDVLASMSRNIRADVPLPDRPILYNRRTVFLQSQVLGCRISIESGTDLPCVEVAESILATSESFLATSALKYAFAREPELTIEVRTSDFAEAPINVSIEERSGRPHLVIRCQKFDPHALSIEQQKVIRDAIFVAAMTALEQVIIFKDSEQNLNALFRDERVSDRAVTFTTTFGTQTNVLGSSPKTRLADWIDSTAKIYPLRRTEPWEPEDTGSNDKQKDDATPPRILQGAEPPPELLDPNLQTHDKIETVSLIRERLWNRAGWTGTGFLTDPTNKYPPVFALIFSNREAAKEIFKYWREELGKADRLEQIRITVVRGIDKTYPHAYRVIVGLNPESFQVDKRLIMFVSRVHRMDATAPDNLDRFIHAYDSFGTFLLAPAHASTGFDGAQTPEFDISLAIALHHVHVRDAWEIGLHDIDSVAIKENDEPIIPEGVMDAPVFELLRKRSED